MKVTKIAAIDKKANEEAYMLATYMDLIYRTLKMQAEDGRITQPTLDNAGKILSYLKEQARSQGGGAAIDTMELID